MGTIFAILIISGFAIWIVLLDPPPPEPTHVNIPVRIEINHQVNATSINGYPFHVIIEPVYNDSDMNDSDRVVPMPSNNVMVLDDPEDDQLSFDEIEFTQPGVFGYRIRQEALDVTEVNESVVEFELDETVFYVTVTVELYQGELITDVEVMRIGENLEELANRDSDFELLFFNQTQYAFLGTWVDGFGDDLNGFRRTSQIVFYQDTVHRPLETQLWNSRLWELTETGDLRLAGDHGERVVEVFAPGAGEEFLDFNIELNGDQLILTDESGNTRSWWREGYQVSRESLPFVGVWKFGHGYRSNRLDGRLQQIEFLTDGSMIVNDQENGTYRWFSWEWDENDQLHIEWRGGLGISDVVTYTIETDGDILNITNIDGNAGTWWREDAVSEMEEDWIITDYLDLFELDENDQIVDNVVISGDQFDFVIYDIESTIYSNERGIKDWYFIVIVKRDGEVFEVIRREGSSEWITIYSLVAEYDFNFDGRNDVFFPPHSHNQSLPLTLFLNLDDRLWEVDEFPARDTWGLYFDDERQLLLFRGFSANGSHAQWHDWSFYTWVGNELILVEQLSLTQFYRRRRIWSERRLVNGYWQESELCFLNDDIYELEWRYGEFCHGYYPRSFGEYEYWDGSHDREFYQRLFGDDAYWDLRWDLRPFDLQE